MIPQELIDLYTVLVKEADASTAGQHLVSFLSDAKAIADAVANVVAAAKSRYNL